MNVVQPIQKFNVMAVVASRQAANRHFVPKNPLYLEFRSAQSCLSSLSEPEPPIPRGHVTENERLNEKSDRLLVLRRSPRK